MRGGQNRLPDNAPCPKCGGERYRMPCGQLKCKACACEAKRNRRKANPDKVRELNRQWRKANTEKVREINRRWQKANPEKARECIRRWYEANKEKHLEYCRQWQKANAERCREHVRSYKATKRFFRTMAQVAALGEALKGVEP